jgi:type IV secretion system protein VirB6
MTFFQNLFENIDQALALFYAATLETMIGYVATGVPIFVIILVITVGMALMFGWVQQAARPIIIGLIMIVIVFTLSSSVASYNKYLGDFLRGLPDELITITAGYASSGVGGQLDAFGNTLLTGLQTLYSNASGFTQTTGVMIICVVFLIAWVFMSVVIAFHMILVKVALSALVAMGPFFIMLLLFPQSRDYFTRWLTYCIQFAFLAAIVGAVMGLTYNLVEQTFLTFDDRSSNIDFVAFAGPLLILVGIWKLMDNVPAVASSLAGGIGMSIGHGVSKAVDTATAPLRAAGAYAYQRGFGEQIAAARQDRIQQHVRTIREERRNSNSGEKKQRTPQPINERVFT